MRTQDPTPGISKNQMVNKFLLKKRLPDGDLDPEEFFNTYGKRVRSTTDANLKTKLTPRVSGEVNCPICLCPILNVQSTLCGHSFCHNCIFEHFLSSKKCPMCRNFIKNLKTVKCKNYEWAIKNYTQQSTELVKRQEDYNAWRDEWKLTDSVIGQKIDARDTCHVWCEAIILDKIEHKNQCATLLIHYVNWNCVYDEFIGGNSPRLAKFKSFTARKDIPRYAKSRDRTDMYTNTLYVPRMESAGSQPLPPPQYSNGPRPMPMYPYRGPIGHPALPNLPQHRQNSGDPNHGYPPPSHRGMYQHPIPRGTSGEHQISIRNQQQLQQQQQQGQLQQQQQQGQLQQQQQQGQGPQIPGPGYPDPRLLNGPTSDPGLQLRANCNPHTRPIFGLDSQATAPLASGTVADPNEAPAEPMADDSEGESNLSDEWLALQLNPNGDLMEDSAVLAHLLANNLDLANFMRVDGHASVNIPENVDLVPSIDPNAVEDPSNG